MSGETRRLALSAVFVGLAVGTNYVLARFPNVELMLSIVFLSGYVLGWRRGMVIGIVAEGIFSLFNPYGMAPIPVLLTQITGVAAAGFAGGWFHKWQPEKLQGKTHSLILGGWGLILTLLFDLLTTLGTAAMIGFSWKSYIALLAFGSLFYLTHLLSNGLIFAVLVHLLIRNIHDFVVAEKSQVSETTP